MGDLTITDDSPSLVLDEVEALNGNITVTTPGDLDAREVVLLNDWNHDAASDTEGDGTDEDFGAANVIQLTAGGTLTVGFISGGEFAVDAAEAEEIRSEDVVRQIFDAVEVP